MKQFNQVKWILMNKKKNLKKLKKGVDNLLTLQ
jgi:hypothetical protein